MGHRRSLLLGSAVVLAVAGVTGWGVAHAANVVTPVVVNPDPPLLSDAWTVSGANCDEFNQINPVQGGVVAAPGMWNAGPTATGVTPDAGGAWSTPMPDITTIGFYRIVSTCDKAIGSTDTLVYRSPWFPVGSTPMGMSVTQEASGIVMSGTNCASGDIVVESRLADGDDNYGGNDQATPDANGDWSINLGQPGADLGVADALYYARCTNGTLFFASGVSSTQPTTVPPTTAAPGVPTTVARGLPGTGRDVSWLVVLAFTSTAAGTMLLLRSRRHLA